MAFNLEEVIFDNGEGEIPKVTNNAKAHILVQCIQGLSFLHSCNVVHCDIKPANILLDGNMQILKMSDMGLSRIKSSVGVTKTKSSVPGTIMYMPPESLVENTRPTKSGDIWSMCVTGCELFTTKDFWNLPEKGKAESIISKRMKKRIEPDGSIVLKKSNPAVYEVLKSGLRYIADQRPTAVELLENVRKMAI